MSRMRTLVTLAVAAAVLIPLTQLRAQSNAPSADELLARARALHESPPLYAVAADLYRRVASMRDASDPRAVDALLMAGRLFTYSGDLGRGRSTMEQAGELALEQGDAVQAARAYADAAFIAAADHSRRASDLARRVVWLAETAPVPDSQRQQIRSMLGPEAVAALWAAAGEPLS
jgi:hypothetical protein